LLVLFLFQHGGLKSISDMIGEAKLPGKKSQTREKHNFLGIFVESLLPFLG
jgi:hypothetical protein